MSVARQFPFLLLSCFISTSVLAEPVQYRLTLLPTLSSAPNASSAAYGINNLGQVVGVAHNDQGGVSRYSAFVWDNANAMRALPEPIVENGYSSAEDINDLGDVVGYRSMNSNGEEHGQLWMAGSSTAIALGRFPGSVVDRSHAYSINNSGVVVGFADREEPRAAYWGADLQIQDAGDLPSGRDFSIIHQINEQGQAVGYAFNENWQRSALWQSLDAGPVDIDPEAFASVAYGINDSGQIVGTRAVSDNAYFVAYIWDAVNGVREIQGNGVEVPYDARAINDAGQVVGYKRQLTGPYTSAAYVWDEVNGVLDLKSLIADNPYPELVLRDALDSTSLGKL